MGKNITFKKNNYTYKFTKEQMDEFAAGLPQPHRDVLILYYGLDNEEEENDIEDIMEYFEDYENCPFVMTPDRIRRVLSEALDMVTVELDDYKPTSKPRTLTKKNYYHAMKLPLAGRNTNYCYLQLVATDDTGLKNLKLIDDSKEHDGHVELDFVLKHREGLLILSEISWFDIQEMFERGQCDPAADDYFDLLKERFGFADFCIAPTFSSLYGFKGILYEDSVIEKMDEYFLDGLIEEAGRFIGYLNEEIGKPVVADIDLSAPKAEDMLNYLYLGEKEAAKTCFFNTFFMADMAELQF